MSTPRPRFAERDLGGGPDPFDDEDDDAVDDLAFAARHGTGSPRWKPENPFGLARRKARPA